MTYSIDFQTFTIYFSRAGARMGVAGSRVAAGVAPPRAQQVLRILRELSGGEDEGKDMKMKI